jgi:hypothetical protein
MHISVGRSLFILLGVREGPFMTGEFSHIPQLAHALALVRSPNLPAYLPLASRVKPLQLNNFERQVLFLLATPLYIEQ